MTQHIDTKALQEAINEVRDEKFAAEMREWLVYGAPKDVVEIWKRYTEKAEERDNKTRWQVVMFLALVAACVVIFAASHIWAVIKMAGCFK
jgi:hypothetical protein